MVIDWLSDPDTHTQAGITDVASLVHWLEKQESLPTNRRSTIRRAQALVDEALASGVIRGRPGLRGEYKLA